MTFQLELEKIVGKERHRTDPRTGRNYTPKQTRLAEEAVRKAYRAEHEDHGDFDGIVTVAIETFRPLAKSNPKYWVGRADLGQARLGQHRQAHMRRAQRRRVHGRRPRGDGWRPEGMPHAIRHAAAGKGVHHPLHRGIHKGEKEMKYVKNNRADEFGTFTQLDGIMKCSAAIATNTALKVAGMSAITAESPPCPL